MYMYMFDSIGCITQATHSLDSSRFNQRIASAASRTLLHRGQRTTTGAARSASGLIN